VTGSEPTPSVESCRSALLATCHQVYKKHQAAAVLVIKPREIEASSFSLDVPTSTGHFIHMVYYPPKVLKKVPAMMPQSDISISIHAVDDARYEKPVAAFLLSRGKPEVITHKRFPEGALGEREVDTADVIAALLDINEMLKSSL